MPETFIEKHKVSWLRLEELIGRIRQLNGLRKFSRAEVRELGSLYRRTASDLAVARVESRDPRLVSYLNSLVIRAHGEIYRSESRGMRGIADFYLYEFPAVFRKTFRYTLAVFLIFMIMLGFSFIATWRSDDFSELAGVPPSLLSMIKGRQMWTDSLIGRAPIGAAGIMVNNIGVGILTFAFSIIPVVGTIWKLWPSAIQIGAVTALTIKYHMGTKLFGFISGHGVLELMAIFIAGGAGLIMGMSVIMPGERTRKQALIEKGAVAIKLLAGSIPLLVIAGCIEGFISPLNIHHFFKFGVSIVTALALAAYLARPEKEPNLE